MGMKYNIENIYDLFLMSLEKYGINHLVDEMQVNKNTINRWLLLKNVPKYYFFDLCNLLEIDVDYSEFSVQEKDQFFTSKETVIYCLSILNNKL